MHTELRRWARRKRTRACGHRPYLPREGGVKGSNPTRGDPDSCAVSRIALIQKDRKAASFSHRLCRLVITITSGELEIWKSTQSDHNYCALSPAPRPRKGWMSYVPGPTSCS